MTTFSIIETGINAVQSAKVFMKNIKAKVDTRKAYTSAVLYEKAEELVKEAEEKYKPLDIVFKQYGLSAGKQKKEDVLIRLQLFAIANGINMDIDVWDKAVEKIVDMTKAVNAKTEA